MAKKPSMGRQKIKIAKIETKTHLQVTFSKRRSGLFKKASELCILCGVEIGIVVFSPAGKVFSFGHPNVEQIADRFLSRNPPPYHYTAATDLVEAHRSAAVREMNLLLTQMMSELEIQRNRGEMFDMMRKESQSQSQRWWENPIHELGLQELEILRDSMEELKKIVTQNMEKIMAEYEVVSNNTTNNSYNHDELHSFGFDNGFF